MTLVAISKVLLLPLSPYPFLYLARRIWKDYYSQVSGIVLIVDAVDRERVPEARDELQGLLSIEELANTPIVVLGNKIDKVGAMGEDEFKHSLNIINTTGKELSKTPSGVRPLESFMCSIIKRIGYGEALIWLTKQI